MLKEKYRDELNETSTQLATMIAREIEDVFEVGRGLDVAIRDVVLELGAQLTEKLLEIAALLSIEKGKEDGLTVQRRDTVQFKTVLGHHEVLSPYLYCRESGESSRPMREHFGIVGEQYSDAADRAISDFGAETSNERAAERFEEHYGIDIGRTTVRSRTLAVARAAEEYMRERLSQASEEYATPEARRQTADLLFGEADGCLIRCGELMTAAEARAKCEDEGELQRLAAYEDDDLVRLQNWREVRTGLISHPDEVDPIYVSLRGPWSEVAEQLFGAACEKGLGFDTTVVFAGDGGNGIKRAMELVFPQFHYVLDRPHLKKHVTETGETLGDWRGGSLKTWVEDKMHRIDEGEALRVLAELQDLWDSIPPPPDDESEPEKTPSGRLGRLIKHMTKYIHCIHYADFAANDWPMGSGRAESSQKSLPQERLKLAGACWKEENLTPMCSLRALRANDFWDDFWDWETTRRAA